MGKVYIVGAGPGDSELISVRGKRLVENCDVLIYDRLISDDIIMSAGKDCEKIYVGKENGGHSIRQEKINKIIIDKARQGHIVVRLKGGDPFVFGRGGEEVLALMESNIDFEVVPGITSAIAVPEIGGIPVTHRGISQDIHIVTGHTAETEITDYEALARTKGTIVFLMAAHSIGSIAERLMEYGMDPKTPVAAIERGGAADERIIRTDLKNIRYERIKPPAVIVVGKTAEFDMVSESKRKTVAITGTEDFRNRLKAKLLKKDYIVKEACRLETVPNDIDIDIDTDEYDWLVFTGRNGVRIFFDYIKNRKKDLRNLKNKIAVIGQGTYDALAEYGIYADYMPPVYTSEELGKGLNNIAENESKLILRAENGSEEIYKYIKNYREVKLYSTKAEYITQCAEDYIVFGSSLGVNTYLDRYDIKDSTGIIAIGEVTCKALRTRGYDAYCCKSPTVEDIVEAIDRYEKIKTIENK